MKYLICLCLLAGLTGCQQIKVLPEESAGNVETVSPRDYQNCINTLKSGDDEDAAIRCGQLSEEIHSGKSD